MKKVITFIFILTLCCGFCFFMGDNIVFAEEIIGGDNCETATLLTEQTTEVILRPDQFWIGESELWANNFPYFKFIPSQSGNYTITIQGTGSYSSFSLFVYDENSTTKLYSNIDFNTETYKTINDVEEGKTYYVYIDVSTNETTNYTIEFDKPLMSSSTEDKSYTINAIEDIIVYGTESKLPKATVLDGNGDSVTGKTVEYICEALSDYAVFYITDHCVTFDENTPLGTYTVTVSLEDNSAEPITFDIIIGNYSIALSPNHVELVKDGTDADFYVAFPETAVLDAEGNPVDLECEIAGDDFRDYIVGEPTEEGFSLSKNTPLSTYVLKYCIEDKEQVTEDFEIILRNPSVTYIAGEGGSITGETKQTVASGTSGTEVMAVPDSGYIFSKWSDGITTALRTDKDVTADINVTAEFRVNPSVVNLNTAWTGDTLENKVKTIIGDNLPTDIVTLNITAGELTDDDVMWIGKNLINLQTLNITGKATFTDNYVPDNAFGNDTYNKSNLEKLKSVTIDLDETELLTFGEFVFRQSQVLTYVNIPQATTFGSAAFMFCTSLKTINLPKVKTFDHNAFAQCNAIVNINLPQATTFGYYAFENCKSLTNVNLPQAVTFGGEAFENCEKSITLTLGSTYPTIIGNVFANYRPKDGGTPKIIVPEDVVDTYKTSDGWFDNLWYGWSLGDTDNGGDEIKVETPTANPNGGNFIDSTQVTLACTTTGASIYFTLDESNPTTDNNLYISPITIEQSTTLKAIATTAGGIDSDILTVIFTKDTSLSGSNSNSSSNNDNTVKGETDNESFDVGSKETKYNSEGKKETVVTVEESAIRIQVDKAEKGKKISIPVLGNMDVLKTKLSVQSIEDMQKKDLILEVKTEMAVYELRTDAIDVKKILDMIGEDVASEDIPFTIEISKTNNEMVKVVKNAVQVTGISIVVPSVDFKIEANYNGKSYEIENFNSFITRIIAIPSDVDAGEITTAIITDPDGSIRHIPTYVTKVNGQYFATINSLTNSTYTLIHNKVAFSDVTDSYWTKADIEKMASRLVVEGKEDGTFSPDEAITRAELAQILVKSLGLKAVEVNQFVDIEQGTKYAEYIGTAYSYGIIKGISETTFEPEKLVNRQDAMIMIYRTGMIAGLRDGEYVTDINNYVDYKDVSDYAKEAVAWNVNNGIILGKTETTLMPFDHITRAELAVIINRLLILAGLIE